MGEKPAGVTTRPKFVHLHNHSHYSLLDGLQKVPQMLDRAKDLGMDAMAITDHGTLTGAIEFYKEAAKREIKPLIGIETYVAPRKLTDKTGKADANPFHLILLAKNETGYRNLLKLSTIAHLEGFYYKPRVDHDLLAQHHEGLIALSACAGGEVATHIRNGSYDQAKQIAEWYRDTFGEGNYYLELQDHEDQWDEQKDINDAKIKLAGETGIPVVVTADCHYAEHSDREAHEILLCIQTGKTVGDADRMTMDMDLFVSAPEEIAGRWKHLPEALENTVRIAEACDLKLELGGIKIPTFPVPTGDTEQDYLRKLCWQGLAWRYGSIPKEDMALMTEEKARALLDSAVTERADYELGVVEKMGFSGYFLIVADFINWGKNRGIIIGPGRGSAAGSILAFALNITDLDPLKYDLLFERFLNPDRISMPDIDIDFQDDRRGEVIEYVTEKYGQERVAQIITFGTMAARAAVRDAGRALGYPYAEVDAIAKLVPQPVQGRHIPLKVSIENDPDLSREYKNNPRAKKLIDLAIQLEGTIRSNGVHAAGVVIAPDDIVNHTPLQRAQKGGITTQFDMNVIQDDLGLLKMDFLGLSNLTIIKNALRIIKKVYDRQIDIAEIPLDDKKTFGMLARGDTTGVFQLESAGMKRYLRELKPTVFEDIVAMVALYRPGPMQWIDDFISRKHGRTKIEYFHPTMKDALEPTYGVLVYQEQVMQVSKEMCGFTGGQADSLRKAVAKKKPKELAKMKKDFIEGAIKTVNADRGQMEEFWSSLEAFAAYCFPKSHAACYAMIAYQTAYLKAHYPAAFMAALMTSDHDNIDRIAIEVAECKRMGIEVLAPDVNESFSEFGVVPETGKIRFGLGAIKNVGQGAIEALLKAREEGGKFAGVEDFAKRVDAGEVNKKVWESLIKSGAFDSLADRSQLLHNLDTMVSYGAKAQKNALSGQIDIFGSLGEENLPPLQLDLPPTELSVPEKLAWERELLGLYLSRHPLDEYEGYLQQKTKPIRDLNTGLEGRVVTLGGMITTVRRIVTKNNTAMAFVALEDKTGTTELIVFPKLYESSTDTWQPDTVIRVNGKVSTKDREGRVTQEIKVIADKAEVVDYESARLIEPVVVDAGEAAGDGRGGAPAPEDSSEDAGTPEPSGPAASAASELTITLPDLSDTTLLIQLKSLLSLHPGDATVFISAGGNRIKMPFTVAVTSELAASLGALVGPEAFSSPSLEPRA